MALRLITPAEGAFYNGTSDYMPVPCSGVTNDMTWTIQVDVTTLAMSAPTGRTAYVEGSNSTSSSYVYVGLSPNGSVECTARSSTQVFAQGVAVMDLNTRQVLTCVSDGVILSAYLNGLPRAQVSLAGITAMTRDRCTLGALNRPSGITNYWYGEVQNTRVWDHALSPAEVLAESNAPPQPPQPGEDPAHGHTLLVWTPPPATPSVEASQFFQVQRQVYLPTSASSWSDVWNTSGCNRPAYTDEDGISHPAYLCDYFPLLKANIIPKEGVKYEYRVRTVGVAGNPSMWSPPYLMDPQDPTKCYSPLPGTADNPVEVICDDVPW